MNSKETLKRVLSYIDKYKYFLVLSMLFALVSVALTLYAPILVGNAIDCIILPPFRTERYKSHGKPHSFEEADRVFRNQHTHHHQGLKYNLH